MARDQEIKFKPYVGLFFKFCVDKPDIARRVYGNELKNKLYLSIEELPDAILILDEKRNYVCFADSAGTLWTRKTHIEPIPLPSCDNSPVSTLEQIREFLLYCTKTKIKDFNIEKMTSDASGLLPEIDALIKKFKFKILP